MKPKGNVTAIEISGSFQIYSHFEQCSGFPSVVGGSDSNSTNSNLLTGIAKS